MSWTGILATRVLSSNAVNSKYSIKTYPDCRHCLIRKRAFLCPATLARGRRCVVQVADARPHK